MRVLVLPARVLPYPLPDPAGFAPRAPRLTRGSRVDARALAAALVEIGYRRAEVVEEAGEFALRGQIVDVGTPQRFVRAVLDVDTIETLHEFDPATQRSEAALAEAALSPLCLFASDVDVRRRLATWLVDHDCKGAAEAARDGHTPDWWEGFLGHVQSHRHVWEIAGRLVVCERETVHATARDAKHVGDVIGRVAHARTLRKVTFEHRAHRLVVDFARRGTFEHDNDLTEHVRAREPSDELAERGTHNLFVQLGQFPAESRTTLGKERRELGQASRQTPRRLQSHDAANSGKPGLA